jgi:hypothetical protein
MTPSRKASQTTAAIDAGSRPLEEAKKDDD